MSNEITRTGSNFEPKNMQELMQFSEMISKTDLVPKDFIGNPAKIMGAVQFGAEIGLPPMQSLQNIAVINGRPCLWGDAVKAISLSNTECEYIEETFDDATMTAKCTSKRKGAKSEHVTTFSQKDAENAGIWGRNVWKLYPKRMLQMRARGFNLRDNFPDSLKGMITREEAEDMPQVKNITPVDLEKVRLETLEDVKTRMIAVGADIEKTLDYFKVDKIDDLSDDDLKKVLIKLESTEQKMLTEGE